MGYSSKPLHTPKRSHDDRRGGAATRRFRAAFIGRQNVPTTTPDPERAKAFAERRVQRWKVLRRRWTRLGLPLIAAIVLIPLAFSSLRPPLAPPEYAHVRVVNEADRVVMFVNLHSARGKYLLGVMDREESHTYAVEGAVHEDLTLVVRDDTVAVCCITPPEDDERLVFRAVDAFGEVSGVQWEVRAEPMP